MLTDIDILNDWQGFVKKLKIKFFSFFPLEIKIDLYKLQEGKRMVLNKQFLFDGFMQSISIFPQQRSEIPRRIDRNVTRIFIAGKYHLEDPFPLTVQGFK